MNLQILKKTRSLPREGDIFVMRPPDEKFLYGRVISTDAPGPTRGGCVLIYIYTPRTEHKLPVPNLSAKQLLVAPILTNNLPWTRGYFECVEQRPVERRDRLAQNCFKDWRGRYLDENGTELSSPTEPVGIWGLHSFRSIDDEVSRALGIPLAPDD
jgi:hypothetical protein